MYINTYICVYTHMCIYIYIYVIFHCGSSPDIEYSFLCYIVGFCCLSILYIIDCIC